MTKYFVNDEEFDDQDEAWDAAGELFWDSGDFDDLWQNEVDGLEIFKELERLNSPLYYELLDKICERISCSIIEVETEDEDEEEES